jgi:DNA-binding transcriptional regulator LsrR (DeoR family)
MSNKVSIERLDKIIKKLDMITVILMAQSGMKRKEIADAMGVSEKTIERLIPISKIKGKKIEVEKQSEIEGAQET